MKITKLIAFLILGLCIAAPYSSLRAMEDDQACFRLDNFKKKRDTLIDLCLKTNQNTRDECNAAKNDVLELITKAEYSTLFVCFCHMLAYKELSPDQRDFSFSILQYLYKKDATVIQSTPYKYDSSKKDQRAVIIHMIEALTKFLKDQSTEFNKEIYSFVEQCIEDCRETKKSYGINKCIINNNLTDVFPPYGWNNLEDFSSMKVIIGWGLPCIAAIATNTMTQWNLKKLYHVPVFLTCFLCNYLYLGNKNHIKNPFNGESQPICAFRVTSLSYIEGFVDTEVIKGLVKIAPPMLGYVYSKIKNKR